MFSKDALPEGNGTSGDARSLHNFALMTTPPTSKPTATARHFFLSRREAIVSHLKAEHQSQVQHGPFNVLRKVR